jgi:hypothetical protein
MWRVIDLASENEVKTQKDSVLPSAYQHGDASLLYEGEKKKVVLYSVSRAAIFFCFLLLRRCCRGRGSSWMGEEGQGLVLFLYASHSWSFLGQENKSRVEWSSKRL